MRKELRAIDSLIRAGQLPAAAERLNHEARKKISGGEIIQISSLARRAEVPLLGLRLLNPLVRGSARSVVPQPHADEKIQYADCLIALGALAEALALLEGIDDTHHPRVGLLRAFILISLRETRAAIPLLQTYLRSNGLEPYSRLIAQVNLAEACVAEGEFRKAEPLLRDLLFQSSSRKLNFLLGKVLEVSAMSFILQKKFALARKFLDQTSRTLASKESRLEYHSRKWRAILDLHTTDDEEAATKKLRALREEGIARGHWESARLCDRFEAIVRQDRQLLLYVYFGTPNETYRRRLLRDFRRSIPIPKSFAWNPTGPHVSTDHDHSIETPIPKLKSGQLLARLLQHLSSDFYRSSSMVALHIALYPGEFFNPTTSPTRVRTAIRRLREWLETHSAPLRIKESRGFYRLTAAAPCSIRVSAGPQSSTREECLLARLRETFGAGAFSCGQAAATLGFSRRSAQFQLANAVQKGRIEKTGRGISTRYRLISPLT